MILKDASNNLMNTLKSNTNGFTTSFQNIENLVE